MVETVLESLVEDEEVDIALEIALFLKCLCMGGTLRVTPRSCIQSVFLSHIVLQSYHIRRVHSNGNGHHRGPFYHRLGVYTPRCQNILQVDLAKKKKHIYFF